MKVVQAYKKKNSDWHYLAEKTLLTNPLVLVFANRLMLEDVSILNSVRHEFAYEHIVYASTAGEIFNVEVLENTVTVIAIEFEKSTFVVKADNIFNHNKNTRELGAALAAQMPAEGLKHLFVLSEGSFVSGTSLIKGLESILDENVAITGGLSGDDLRYEKTLTSYKEDPKEGEIVLIGFYGESLEITFASYGGWLAFGPERIITKSEGSTLYEIDGQSSLELYKKYLGDKAGDFARSALLYPLNVIAPGKTHAVVRAVVATDMENKAMIFADEVPQDSQVQLIMISPDRISQGAFTASTLAMQDRVTKPQLALVISCIGRKVVMNQRVEEEIELVREVIGEDTAISGFYSYGEIAPFHDTRSSELHNQTMTLTLISE
ncbi:histidine kinase [Flavobacterium rivuli WB 3.3-2 = DSM 21788]|uniref:Histidine kinase n=1 Tax=Flavobacterium rivuli WB 3.3-2 = DSM 21788 TaxID=1121895 RepID=A0A0A2M4Z9_9FLAO|nr:FIST N-terminal domain-containing protein [Flavobacterium rivuli]KGO87359.1 histidine kinase [Flavobacterium rivuli WB 3.3-2 = DSM 21788]